MKSLQLLAAGLLAVTLTGTASAQSIIRIAGSTAFRTSTHKGIEDVLDSGFTYVFKNKGATGSGQEFKASAAIFSGTLKDNATLGITGHPAVIIKTFWTGSLSGVIDLAQQNPISTWIANSELPPAHANGFNFDAASYTNESPAVAPQVAMSDNDFLEAASSVATANGGAAVASAIKAAGIANGGSAANANGAGTVGAVPFVWAKGVGAPSTINNITQQVAAELIKTGNVPVGAFTQTNGNSALPITGATTDFVFLAGRSEDSGTRIVNFAEPQTGFGQPCAQYRISYDSGTNYTDNGQTVQTGGAGANMTALKLWDANWPVNTATSISWTAAGHAGFVAGGDIVNNLKATSGQVLTPTTGAPSSSFFLGGTSKCYLVGYAGFADASALPAAQRLTYNGVAYSVSNVQNGTYSLWSFEHLYYRTALIGADATAKKAADAIADKIYLVDAPTDATGNVDNSGANAGVAGILFDINFNYTKSKTGAYLTPF